MKNKVGIVTFTNAINYGAVFQTYALQEFLKKREHNVDVINYKCKFIEQCYSPFYISNKKILNALIRGIAFGKTMNSKKKKFDKFCKNYLSLTDEITSAESMKCISNNYEYFISGSDQVWSPISANFDDFYFLPFAKKEQAFSYAASIGVDKIDDSFISEYKTRLNKFPFYSVREESAKKILEKIFPKKEVFVHCDPTLLLKKNDWIKIADSTTKKEKYLLVFNVEKEINDLEFAKKVAAKKGLKIYYINDRTIIKDKGIKYIEAPTPNEFLGYFNNADYIVTNSFHGTVFSIIFNKEFAVEIDNKKAKNIRSEGLLDYLNLSERIIKSNDYINFKPIDWSKVEEKISLKRQEAEQYFKMINNR